MAETDKDLPPETDAAEEDAHALSEARIARIMEAVEKGDRARLWAETEPLHAADIADLLEQISSGARRRLIALYGPEFDGDILSELDESIREEVIGLLQPDVLAEAVRELDSDDVVDLVEDLEDAQQEAILDILEAADRLAVQQSLTYPDYSAGRLMQREVVMAPEHWSVGDVIDFMRRAQELPEQFYHVTLVDPRLHPVGNVTLGRIMAARRATLLRDLVEETFHTFTVTDEEGDVAYAFNQYHLISAPVVDEEGRLVGVITIDDAMTVLDEEHEEDILRLAGVGEEGGFSGRLTETIRDRAIWLFVNLLTAILASVVIEQFATTIDQMVALAVLMPIVASMGGNAGTQTMTVAVRALATRDLTARNAMRVVLRELAVGGANGATFGIVMAGVVGLWFGVPLLAAVIAVAMLLTLMAAALGGIVIPMALDRFGIDPALASGPFVTTITDVVGFFAFLGLASLVLL
ncbi:magnesium transporter [Roseovarius sp. MBR-78]|uniref:magnesium transporter n=1 Tax=Roseovarius sp. MBR-78 TaxID=3156460 RepID=UPI003392CE97